MTPEQANDTESPPPATAEPSVGVLAALPRTRPQRASVRRAAARARAQSETAAPARATPARGEGSETLVKPKTVVKPKAGKAKPELKTEPKTKTKPRTQAELKTQAKSKTTARRKPVKHRSSGAVAEPVPRQGYEPEEEIELGNTVHPPSGGELVESLADILSELASAGAGAGGRMLKDALSIFRRP